MRQFRGTKTRIETIINNRKMSKLKFLVLLLFVIGCIKKNEVVEGDLFFKLIDFGSFYAGNDVSIKVFEKKMDSIRWSKIASEQDLKIIKFIDKLKKNNLLKSPWINLKTKDSVIKIYFNKTEYNKLKKYNFGDLTKRNRKVKLKLDLELKDTEIYFCNKILSIEEVDGKTEFKK
jgi:hypothetical protein